MRVTAALLLLAACGCRATKYEHGDNKNVPQSTLERFTDKVMVGVLRSLDRRQDKVTWPEHVVKCARSLGVAKCVQAFSAWRAQKSVALFTNDKHAQLNLTNDLDHFRWERYLNNSDEELREQLSNGTVGLLRYRSLTLSMIPGLQLELGSNRDGILKVDVCSTKASEGESRGTGKKMIKQFYRILPMLLVPGLIMAAILPFVLPALKMMTVGVGILNQMALSGAVFTLLRNNAFNDKYTKKIIYVNEGYKNEKHAPIHVEDPHHDVYYHDDESYAGSSFNGIVKPPAEWYYNDAVDVKDYKNRRTSGWNGKSELSQKII